MKDFKYLKHEERRQKEIVCVCVCVLGGEGSRRDSTRADNLV